MKMINIIRLVPMFSIILVCGLSSIISFSSCNDDSDFSNKLYITQAKYANYDGVTMTNGVGNYNITVSSSYKTKKDVEVSLKVLDEQFLSEFNNKYKTEYEYIPKEAVSFSSDNVTISENTAVSKGATVTINKWDGFKDGVDYALPVGINSSMSDMPAIDGSDYIVLELSEKVISNAAQIVRNGFVQKEQESIFSPEIGLGEPYGVITIEGKFRVTNGYIVSGNWRSDITTGFGLQTILSANGTMNVRFPDSSFIGGFGTVTLNKWHHYAVVNDNGNITVYFDGEPQATVFNGSRFNVGTLSIANYCMGTGISVDEFRVWRTARTARQIKKYPNKVDPTNPDLLVYYRFDEESGNIAKDETGRYDLQVANNAAVNWISGVTYP